MKKLCTEFIICQGATKCPHARIHYSSNWCKHSEPHPFNMLAKNFANCVREHRWACPGCIDIEEEDELHDLP